ncbi:hypothetical protein J6P59_08000 [bacterium]|nr:hypothetical protein [bacterium]
MDNMINNYFGFNSFNKVNNLLFVQTSTTYNSNYKKNSSVIDKAKEIINELYTKKISYTSLMQKVKNKFKNLTPKQRKFINFFVPRPS